MTGNKRIKIQTDKLHALKFKKIVGMFCFTRINYSILNSINQESYSTQSVLTKQCHNKLDTGKPNV